MARVSIAEVKEEKGKQRAVSLEREGKRILRQTESYVLLDESGRSFSSPEFADFIRGKTSIDFVLGGPYGVSDEVKRKADDCVALSRMTFTHEMARVVFLEQLYRAFTILQGREYHH